MLLWSSLLLLLHVFETGAKDPLKVVFAKHRNTAMKHPSAQFSFSIEECAQKCLGVELGCVGFDYAAGICTISYVLLTEKRAKTDAYLIERTSDNCNATLNQGTQDLMHGKFVKSSAQCISETMIMRPMPGLKGRRGDVIWDPQPNCLQHCLLMEDCSVVEIASSVCRLVTLDGSGDVQVNTRGGTLYVKMDSCAAPPATSISVTPPETKNTLVAIHNRVRSEVARGKHDVFNSTLPAAKNMRKLKWNVTLEIEAQLIANKCGMPVRGTKGMNADRDNKTDVLYSQAQNLTRGWMNGRREIYWTGLQYQVPDILLFDNWMQMMWAESREFGCGIMGCSSPKGTTFVCLYWPPGKVPNTVVYASGGTCSACPSGTKCTEEGEFIGLCE